MTRAALQHDERYDASSIVILPELEAVRRNPSMYVGSTDVHGLHHLIFELVDNAVDESAAGFCTEISVRLHADGACTVEDDGRGIPVDIHPQARRPACEVVLTALHAGAKFERRSYATSAGLHGVGLSCVNALSERLLLDVWRDGHHHRQEFFRGVPAGDLERVGESARHGTRIRFRPDPDIFGACQVASETLVERLEEIAFLYPGLRVRFSDERTGVRQLLARQDGVRGLLEHRNREATAVHPRPILVSQRAGGVALEVALQWT
ncbi:MAG TPA: ATP-binding protein, partial [Kofleriaceae bacterium]|nr:ATP-binding protein [Kofleriaceae bacterium]